MRSKLKVRTIATALLRWVRHATSSTLQLTPRLSNDFTAAWLTFTFAQLFAVAATLKSIDYNVAMTFILNNNNNNNNKWQLQIGVSQWCRSALCGHPLPALTDSWTHGAASRHTITPIRWCFKCRLKTGGMQFCRQTGNSILLSVKFDSVNLSTDFDR